MPRNLALKSLENAADTPGRAERRLEFLFSKTPRLSERDRAFAVQLVQGVLRWQIRIDWVLKQYVQFPFRKIDPPVLDILRLALFQILFLDRVPESAAVNEAVKQTKALGQRHVGKFVNGILRRICREKDHLKYPSSRDNKALYQSVYYAYPLWLVKKWFRELGPDATARLLQTQNEIPRMIIRTNTLKTTREQLLRRFEEEGVAGKAVPFSPEGIQLVGFKGSVTRLKAFREGLFQVQGEAAQVCAHLLSPREGDVFADMCAGLGGKSTHLAQLMKDRGRVLALDNSIVRLSGLGENKKRLGIHKIFPLAADATQTLPFPHGSIQKILVDGPCSGLGVIAKHPDTKVTKKEDDIQRLAMIQKSILSRCCRILKPKGEMLYVTCTISKEENQGVVESILRKNREMALVDLKQRIPEWGLDLVDDDGFLRTFPHLHGMEGFFAALFRKI